MDTVGAGEGEIVLCVQGSSARYTPETKTLPWMRRSSGSSIRCRLEPAWSSVSKHRKRSRAEVVDGGKSFRRWR
ncbi:MAG: EutN/CcmL family microcompartment protein [Planctomycetales bacterium]